jgi:hypothetical protein
VLTSLPVLLEALWSGRRLKFVYEKADGSTSERELDPLGLVARANRWYLVAGKGDEPRTYRVSRIRSPEILAELAERPAAFDLAAHWEASTNRFREHLPYYTATFLVTEHIMPWACFDRGACSSKRAGDRYACRCASTPGRSPAVRAQLGVSSRSSSPGAARVRARHGPRRRRRLCGLRAAAARGRCDQLLFDRTCDISARNRPSGSLKNAIHSSVPSACR